MRSMYLLTIPLIMSLYSCGGIEKKVLDYGVHSYKSKSETHYKLGNGKDDGTKSYENTYVIKNKIFPGFSVDVYGSRKKSLPKSQLKFKKKPYENLIPKSRLKFKKSFFPKKLF